MHLTLHHIEKKKEKVYDKIKEDYFCIHFVGMTTVGAARIHTCIQHCGLNSTEYTVGILNQLNIQWVY